MYEKGIPSAECAIYPIMQCQGQKKTLVGSERTPVWSRENVARHVMVRENLVENVAAAHKM